MRHLFWLESKEYTVDLRPAGKGEFDVTVGNARHRVLVETPCPGELLLNIDGRIYNVIVNSNTFSHSVYVNGRQFRFEKRSALKVLKEERGPLRRRDVKISMPGRVIEVLASPGDTVREGQPVLVVEAMKMQNEMKSPQAGRLSHVFFEPGDYVEAGAVLFTVE